MVGHSWGELMLNKSRLVFLWKLIMTTAPFLSDLSTLVSCSIILFKINVISLPPHPPLFLISFSGWWWRAQLIWPSNYYVWVDVVACLKLYTLSHFFCFIVSMTDTLKFSSKSSTNKCVQKWSKYKILQQRHPFIKRYGMWYVKAHCAKFTK